MCFTASNCLCCAHEHGGGGNRKWCKRDIGARLKTLPPLAHTLENESVSMCRLLNLLPAQRRDAQGILQPSSEAHLQLEGAHCAHLLAMSQAQLCSRASLCIPLQRLPVKKKKKNLWAGLGGHAVSINPWKKKGVKHLVMHTARPSAVSMLSPHSHSNPERVYAPANCTPLEIKIFYYINTYIYII